MSITSRCSVYRRAGLLPVLCYRMRAVPFATTPDSQRAAATPEPGAFAFVMATGIVARDLYIERHHSLSFALTGICIAGFVLLIALSLVRFTRYRGHMRADARNPAVTCTFLTFVAGCVVLAAQPEFIDHLSILAVLGIPAVACWLLMLPYSLRVLQRAGWRNWARIARGNWLLVTVSTQAVAIVATATAVATGARALVVAAIVIATLGLALYAIVIVPVASRLFDAVVSRNLVVFTADFWITMGALAISTLCAARVLTAVSTLGMTHQLVDPLRVAGAIVWILASAWIPFLIASEIGKLLDCGFPHFETSRWSTVFPLGMYAAGSGALHDFVSWPVIGVLAHVFAWIALAVWLLTLIGMLRARRRAYAHV